MKGRNRIFVMGLVLAIGSSLACHRNQPQTGFTGKVVGVDGSPVVGAYLQMTRREGRGFVGAETGLDGRFTLSGLDPASEYDLTIDAIGCQPILRKRFHPNQTDVAFTMGSAFRLSGGHYYATDEKGNLVREGTGGQLIKIPPEQLVKERKIWCAVWRELIVGEKEENRAAFLDLGIGPSANPDQSVVDCVRQSCPRAQPAGSARQDGGHYYDSQTGELGILLTIQGVHLESNRQCHVEASWYLDPLGAKSFYFLLEKRGGQWIIKVKELTSIS